MGIPQEPFGMGKLREVPPAINGPPNGPLALRVSTTRHGVIGMNRRPAAEAVTVTPNVSLTPEYDAVKVTSVGVATVPPLRVNVPEVDPCAMVIFDGRIAPEGDELSAMVAPPLGAADVSATVHVAVDGGAIDTELHENPFKPNAPIATVPPVVVIGMAEPPASDETAFVSWTNEDLLVVELDNTSDTVATTPLPIVSALSPQTKHVNDPNFVLHESDLFAAVATGPAARVAEEKSVVE